MNNFLPESFSSGFKVEKMKVGSYTDMLKDQRMRDVIKRPEVDCYILQLGVNDYRYRNCSVKGAGGGLHGNFLKIDFLVVSNRGE